MSQVINLQRYKGKYAILLAIVAAVILIVVSIGYSSVKSDGDSFYKTSGEILSMTDTASLGSIYWVEGNITNTELNGGAGRVYLDETLKLGLSMSLENSSYVMKGDYTFLKAEIQRVDACCFNWDITRIIGD